MLPHLVLEVIYSWQAWSIQIQIWHQIIKKNRRWSDGWNDFDFVNKQFHLLLYHICKPCDFCGGMRKWIVWYLSLHLYILFTLYNHHGGILSLENSKKGSKQKHFAIQQMACSGSSNGSNCKIWHVSRCLFLQSSLSM